MANTQGVAECGIHEPRLAVRIREAAFLGSTFAIPHSVRLTRSCLPQICVPVKAFLPRRRRGSRDVGKPETGTRLKHPGGTRTPRGYPNTQGVPECGIGFEVDRLMREEVRGLS